MGPEGLGQSQELWPIYRILPCSLTELGRSRKKGEEANRENKRQHAAELRESWSSPAPRLKAVAASCIDYACVPLSKQASWARAEVCWIIYVLALAFTELWAEFKGKR